MQLTGTRSLWLCGMLLVCLTVQPIFVGAQEGGRKVISKAAPTYPEIARRLNIQGTVKLQVTIAKDGTVKIVKPIGGHPLLIDPAVTAMKTWKYEPGPEEIVTVEFKFPPAT
jgi:TonB family protein